MNEQILESIKTAIGPSASYDVFDPQIVMYINTCFGVLRQLGAGPIEGFRLTNADASWDSWSSDQNLQDLAKSFIKFKVQLMFDPPSNSFTLEHYNKLISELEWRINIMCDPSTTFS